MIYIEKFKYMFVQYIKNGYIMDILEALQWERERKEKDAAKIVGGGLKC